MEWINEKEHLIINLTEYLSIIDLILDNRIERMSPICRGCFCILKGGDILPEPTWPIEQGKMKA